MSNVPLKQLANELGFHGSSIRKAAITRGFKPFRLSDGNNKPLYLNRDDAKALKERIESERLNLASPNLKPSNVKISGVYFIVVPSYDAKNRVKIGWSDNLHERFSAYRTIVPDLIVKAVWQTTDSWCEKAALKCAEEFGARIHNELFEFDDVDLFLEELTNFFLKIGRRSSEVDFQVIAKSKVGVDK